MKGSNFFVVDYCKGGGRFTIKGQLKIKYLPNLTGDMQSHVLTVSTPDE
jgi:hypothetical protein